ncbi:MAG: CIA30 family protein [Rhodospirillaceae bacterium]|nr:CIA30 family protein [Rhodospirillaceae bacterium]
MAHAAVRRKVLAMGGSLAATAVAPPARAVTDSARVLDDLSDPDAAGRAGARWLGFTDQVMGGRSQGQVRRDEIDGRPCLRLTGRVSTDGGGFIQMALEFGETGRPLDATGTSGLSLDIWGNGERYNCHLRTTDVRWYEQSYRATFTATPAWQTVRLAWADFAPHGLSQPLNLGGLLRIGLLGWMRDFDADLALARIALV